MLLLICSATWWPPNLFLLALSKPDRPQRTGDFEQGSGLSLVWQSYCHLGIQQLAMQFTLVFRLFQAYRCSLDGAQACSLHILKL